MKKRRIGVDSIAPVPGCAVYVQHLEDGSVMLRQEVPYDKPELNRSAAEYAAERMNEAVAAGHTVILYVYSGDTGELLNTAVADASGKRVLG